MVQWKKNLLFVWLSQTCSTAGFASTIPFIPLFIQSHFHVTDEETLGLQVSLFNFAGCLSFCIAAPIWGALADRFGRKIMLLRACFISALLFPLLYYSPNIFCLVAVRFLFSLFSGTITAAQTLVATTTPEEHHGMALGILSTAMWSGNILGFMFGSLIMDMFGFFWGFMSTSILLALGGFVGLFVVEDFHPSPLGLKKRKSSWTDMFSGWNAVIWLVMALFVMMGFARRFDDAYLPIMIQRLDDVSSVVRVTGLICTAAALGGIVSGAVLGYLCDRWNPLKVAYPVILIAAAGALIQASSSHVIPFGVARFVTFFAAGGLEPVFQTMLAANVSPEKRGTLFGVASSLRMFGILLAALLGGGVIWLGGVRAVFYTSAGLFLLLLP